MMMTMWAVAMTMAMASTATAIEDIPSLGLGTWLSDRAKVPHAVEFGLQNGYDHIDAAWIYRNEDQTGNGIAAASLPRDAIWVTSKLWNTHHRADEAPRALQETLAHLGLAYLDLYLIHWPVAMLPHTPTQILDPSVSLAETWRTMEDLVRRNLTRHIGLSNFARADVDAILAICTICPYAHEFETHPYLQQQDFVDYHVDKGILVIAYSPLGNTNGVYQGQGSGGSGDGGGSDGPGQEEEKESGRHADLAPLLENPFWTALAAAKNVTPAQAVLAWGMQRGTVVIPKSTSETHLLENVAAREEVVFTDEEMAAIAEQDQKARFNNPSRKWGVKLFADLDDPLDIDEEEEEVLVVVVDEL